MNKSVQNGHAGLRLSSSNSNRETLPLCNRLRPAEEVAMLAANESYLTTMIQFLCENQLMTKL
jgi:hypothetical protein